MKGFSFRFVGQREKIERITKGYQREDNQRIDSEELRYDGTQRMARGQYRIIRKELSDDNY